MVYDYTFDARCKCARLIAGMPCTHRLTLAYTHRCSRRFRASDSVTCVFDFVDVSVQGTEGVPGPGKYRLVAQYPRRVLEDTDLRTLKDAGLDGRNEALMLEPL